MTPQAPPLSLRERLLADLPVTTRTVDIGGVSTALIAAGDGPPLVLLHGGIECGGVMWAPVLRSLAADHRVAAPDVPGLGASDPLDRLDVVTFSEWFASLLDATGMRRPCVVAHSLIGSLAARAAARDNKLFGSLVVYAAPGVGPYRMPTQLRYAAIRMAIRPTARNAERFERFALFDLDATRRRDPDWFRAFDEYTRLQAHVRHVKRTMRQLVAAQTKRIADAELDLIDVPTSLIWGRHDRMAPLDVARFASARHGWPLHVVEGAGHAPHIEQPEAFVERLRAAGR